MALEERRATTPDTTKERTLRLSEADIEQTRAAWDRHKGNTTHMARDMRLSRNAVQNRVKQMRASGVQLQEYPTPRGGWGARVDEPVRRRETVLFLPDRHEPYTDKRAKAAIYEYVAKHYSPTRLVLGGDYADLFEFSGFPSTPQMHPDEEVEHVIRCLEEDAETWEDCRRTYILGNHEKRVQRYIQTSAPKLARIFGDSIPQMFELERLGYEFVDNEDMWERSGRFFQLGKLIYLHGHELKGCGFKYTSQRMAETFRANIISGHLHTSDASRPMKDLHGHTIRCWLVGCACSILPRYKPGASHVHGFAVIVYDDGLSGHFTLHNHILDENYKVR